MLIKFYIRKVKKVLQAYCKIYKQLVYLRHKSRTATRKKNLCHGEAYWIIWFHLGARQMSSSFWRAFLFSMSAKEVLWNQTRKASSILVVQLPETIEPLGKTNPSSAEYMALLATIINQIWQEKCTRWSTRRFAKILCTMECQWIVNSTWRF